MDEEKPAASASRGVAIRVSAGHSSEPFDREAHPIAGLAGAPAEKQTEKILLDQERSGWVYTHSTPGFRNGHPAARVELEVFTMLSLRVNRKTYSVDAEPETPLLWVIRDTIGLTGTKFGCGMALCGACTVHVNGKPVRSCVTRASRVVGQEVTTIEGLSPNAQHPAQIAWREGDVPACGYCQSGQIMAAAALLAKKPNPTDTDIEQEITNLCRCGTYRRIRQAIHRAAQIAAKS